VELWSKQSCQYGSYSFTIGPNTPKGNVVFGLVTPNERDAITFRSDLGGGWVFSTRTGGANRDVSDPLDSPPEPGDVFTFVWKKAYAGMYRNGTLVAEKRGSSVPSTPLYLNSSSYGGGLVSFKSLGPSVKAIMSGTCSEQQDHVNSHQTTSHVDAADGRWHLINSHQTTSHVDVADGRWHLTVAVYGPVGNMLHKQLYVDGRLVAQDDAPLPLHKNSVPVCLGANNSAISQEFNGYIDEVAIFARALSPDNVTKMYQAGNPNSDSEEHSNENEDGR
jgi:hypothetical protein